MFESLFNKKSRNTEMKSKTVKSPRANLSIESLENREVLSATWVGDPGTTRNTAYQVGEISGEARYFNGEMEQKNDVDLFAIDVKAGQTIKIRIDDTWNHKHGSDARGLRVNLNLYNSKGTRAFWGGPHQNKTSGFDTEIRASRDERFYIGISAAGNGLYNVNTGGRTVAPKYMATGGYTLSIGEPSAFKRYQPGIYVAGRDLNFSGGSAGTHQFLILVPENPNNFTGARDLGDGTKGLVIGAHQDNGRLVMRPFEDADLLASLEYGNPDRDFDPAISGDFGTEIASVNLAGRNIDSTIKAIVQASQHYASYSKSHPIQYPTFPAMLRGQGVNSNSWAQSIIEHVVGPNLVQQNFSGRDLLYWKRIGREYFIPEGPRSANKQDVTILGTSENDQISIRNVAGTVQYEILVNGVTKHTGSWNATKALTIDGGSGDDVISFEAIGYAGITPITLIGGDGNDTIYGGYGGDAILGGNGNDQLHGYEGNDLILGDEGDDLIGGGLGNDVLYGQGGNDRVFGHEGNDGVFGGNGDDWLEGNEDNDNLGNDAIFGEPGNDTMQGGTGNDYLFGGDGNDVIWGGLSTNVWGVDGDDRIEGGAGRDIMMGQDGNDTMLGGSENDELYGGYGNDYLDGQHGDDIVSGEWGDDEVRGSIGNDWVTGNDGNDRLYGDEGDDLLLGHVGNDILSGGTGNDTLYGGAGADEIYGDDGDDAMYGEEGNDFLAGFGGNDGIHGQQGNDTLRGGTGDDFLHGGDGIDGMSGGEGNDYLQGDEGADDMWGDAGEDHLVGGMDNDVLRGGDGNDLIIGSAGIDIHEGGAGNDTIISLDGVPGDVVQAGSDRDIVWADSIGDVVTDAEVVHRVASFVNGADLTLDGDRISDPDGEVYLNYASLKLFPTMGPGPQDCVQGGVGNCPVVAQLASVAHQNPLAISDRMVSFGDGTYGLKLGEEFYRVDADLPVSNTNTLKYANTGREGAIWGGIFEKALVAYRLRHFPTLAQNTYPSLIGADGSDVLRSLGHPERHTRHYPEEFGSLLGFLNEVGRQFDLKNNVSVGVRVTSDVPLVGSHAYTVMAVQRDSTGTIQTVTLRNPWGVDGIANGSDPNDGLVIVSASQFMKAIYQADWGKVS